MTDSAIIHSSIRVLNFSPTWVQALEKELNLFTLEDILLYAPSHYNDRSKILTYTQISGTQDAVQLIAQLERIDYVGQGVKRRLEVRFRDASATFSVIFFKRQQYIFKKLQIGANYVIFGKPTNYNHIYSFVHPEVELLIPGRKPRLGFEPVYETTEALKKLYINSRRFQQIVLQCFQYLNGNIEEFLPPDLMRDEQLMPRRDAFLKLHFPHSRMEMERAKFRFKYEEWFLLQIEQADWLLQETVVRGLRCTRVGNLFNAFYKEYLAFDLTDAQKRVLRDIHADMKSGRQMNRLLQGDVGSGKTLVALFALLLAADNDLQGCLMAPTEILATQHYLSICRMLAPLNVRVALLTGSTPQRERRVIHDDLESGKLQIIIGTHALIEDDVRFHNLGLVIVDEQHRFGVAQRAKLWGKNPNVLPHILVMSATPIPRTLALTLYAGLDISVIDQLPAGRKAIYTRILYENQREKLYKFLKEEIGHGHQVYIVYPLVNESEKLDFQSVTEGYQRICEEFPTPEYRVGMLHGQMPTDEKESVMNAFSRGELQILVATTVIEVGVDVPNATVIVIEDAQRFGLTQLHQLRGRVGRGDAKSYCFLVTNYEIKAKTRERLRILEQTNDGFKIADADLRLRGFGELGGLAQSGKSLTLQFVDFGEDVDLIEKVRHRVRAICLADSDLEAEPYQPLKRYIEQRKKRAQVPMIAKIG